MTNGEPARSYRSGQFADWSNVPEHTSDGGGRSCEKSLRISKALGLSAGARVRSITRREFNHR